MKYLVLVWKLFWTATTILTLPTHPNHTSTIYHGKFKSGPNLYSLLPKSSHPYYIHPKALLFTNSNQLLSFSTLLLNPPCFRCLNKTLLKVCIKSFFSSSCFPLKNKKSNIYMQILVKFRKKLCILHSSITNNL